MKEKQSYDPERTLAQAQNMGRERGVNYITPELLLIALLRNEESVRRFILKFDVRIGNLETKLDRLIVPPSQSADGTQQPSGISPEVNRILNKYNFRAMNNAQHKDEQIRNFGHAYIPDAVDLFIALLEERCPATIFLERAGLTLSEAVEEYKMYVMKGGRDEINIVTNAPALSEFGENLNMKALRGKLQPVIGREEEIDRIIQILCREEKNNPLLVGLPGVGKTAIIEGLARRINEGNVPGKIAKKNIFTLDMGSLVAGTKYRGQFEERIKAVLKEIRNNPDIIIFLDEMHTMVGAGAAEGSLDAAELMKTGLARGEIRCIGATDDDNIKTIEKDNALNRRFQQIYIAGPKLKDTLDILKGRKKKYEQAHEVIIPDELLPVIADLSSRYVTDRAAPDKDIDIMDETGARLYLNKKNGETPVMTVADVEYTAAKIANLRPETVCADGAKMVRNLEGNLKKRVINQDHAIESIVRVVKRSRAGIADPCQPVGSFLFTGPTGVGKTELAESLADEIGVPLVRINMSEYQDSTSVKKFYGADPGYVGYEEGGALTGKVRRHPHCVLLLDEIEKAHPDVFHALLQVLDKGVMTDNRGREVKFKNVILIMTANIRKEVTKPTPGFQTAAADAGDTNLMNRKSKEIASVFSPEFRNRLDDVIEFFPLKRENMMSIADKFMNLVQDRIAHRGIEISLDEAAKDYLARNGHDSVMGARPLKRLIDKEVIDSMVDEIVFGRIKDGGTVVIGCAPDGKGGEKLTFTFNEKAKGAKPELRHPPAGPQPPSAPAPG